jgi:hypothetical protein
MTGFLPKHLRSPTPDVVNFANVPNTTGNENLTLKVESGSHTQAACLTDVLLFLPTFANFPVGDEKHTIDGCPVTSSPTPAPSDAPSSGAAPVTVPPSLTPTSGATGGEPHFSFAVALMVAFSCFFTSQHLIG